MRTITPEDPTRLAGYGNRTAESTDTDADLHARAIAFEDGDGERAVIVSLDVLGITRDLRATVADACEANYGLSPGSLLLNASHTHHGPEYREDEWGIWGMDDRENRRASEYAQRLADEVIDAVGAALADLVPVRLRYSHARCGFAMNRRRPTPEGFQLAAYPDGPVDHDVPVLVAETADEIRAICFGYACHPTSRPKRLAFHPDWPGIAAARLEDAYPGATAAFVQGCGADQNPYPRREVEFTETQGRSMADAVRAAIDAGGSQVQGSLQTCYEEITLAFADQPDREELESIVAGATAGDETYARRFLDELDRDGAIRTEFPYPLQAIGFGSAVTLLALAGEVVVDYAHTLKRELRGEIWVAGYSNDGYVYVPSARILHEGGYEAEWVDLYWDYPNPLQSTVEGEIVETALALAQRVGAPRRSSS